ncbi:MAG: 30S ribosomal protein S14 [Candidatus Anstonellales archaeon]
MNEKKSRRPKEYKLKGKYLRMCRFCKTARGLIRSYGLMICRRCFREVAEQIGFRKY